MYFKKYQNMFIFIEIIRKYLNTYYNIYFIGIIITINLLERISIINIIKVNKTNINSNILHHCH